MFLFLPRITACLYFILKLLPFSDWCRDSEEESKHSTAFGINVFSSPALSKCYLLSCCCCPLPFVIYFLLGYRCFTMLYNSELAICIHILIGEGNGSPLQCSCLENPRDRGAWWDAVYGVPQSRARLK